MRDFIKEQLNLPFTPEYISGVYDPYFKGVIDSLFYKPNHYVLVLETQDYFDNNPLRLFSPEEGWDIYNSLYHYVNFEKKNLDLPNSDNFRIVDDDPYPSADKRLASYWTITEKWVYKQRKNFIVVNELPNINLNTLRELYAIHKPK